MPMIPLSWMAEHTDVLPGTDAQTLASALVRVGLEEETIHPARVTGPLVVGKVLTIVKEEQSNGKIINYCRVDVGEHNDAPGSGKEPSDLPSRGIICGAHNFVEGDLVVVSLPGAVLPGPFPIASRKTYGHISDGMICSARELGMGEDHDGIIVLPQMFPDRDIPEPGHDLISFLGLGEEVLEINVTPDRGYCFSMRGVAREYSHSTGTPFRDPGLRDDLPAPTPNGFPVLVQDNAPIRGNIGCDRFVTRIVRGINPNAPTPRWMIERLEMAGMRSLSLAIDITNYVMLDLGQPMHAYDLAALQAPIVVRRARAGEHLTTLDEVQRELNPEDLLITDSPEGEGSRIIGLAGVMGGQYSEVEDTTVDVLLEAAHFDAVSIARTSRRHRLHSEAAKRFERGTDPLLPAVAAQRAVELLVEYGGGTADEAVFDYNDLSPARVIVYPLNEAARLTGVEHTAAGQRKLLETIGCAIEGNDTDATWKVSVPSWRPDLVGPAHLVEEIARLDGYDNIPSILPPAPAGHGLTPAQKARRIAAATLAQAGLVQVESYPFVAETIFERQGMNEADERRQALRLRNPLADDAPLLRTSILDSLLDVAARNVSRGLPAVALYEVAKVVRPAGTVAADLPSAQTRPTQDILDSLEAGTPAQPWHIGAVMSGNITLPGVLETQRPWEWSDALEAVRQVASALGVRVEVTRAWDPQPPALKGAPVPAPAVDPSDVAPWHPGRVARIFVRQGRDLTTVAMAGELLPATCKEFGLPARSVAFEIDLEALIACMDPAPIQVKAISTHPIAKEDVALVVPATIPVARVEQVIRQAAGSLAEDISLFDIYDGDQVEEGYRSLAFALRLRSDHTLTAQETARVRDDIVAKAQKVLGASLRS